MADFLQKKKAKAFAIQNTDFFFLILQRVFCLQEQYYRFILMRIFEVYLSLGHLGIFMLFVLCLSWNKMYIRYLYICSCSKLWT